MQGAFSSLNCIRQPFMLTCCIVFWKVWIYLQLLSQASPEKKVQTSTFLSKQSSSRIVPLDPEHILFVDESAPPLMLFACLNPFNL